MPELLPPPQTIVVFGASGDLSRRKIIPALYNLSRDGLLPEQYAVVGYAPNPWDTTAFLDFARQSVASFSRSSLREDAWARFERHLHYVAGDFDSSGSLAPLEAQLAQFDAALGTGGRRLLFCAVPASIVPTLITRLGECGPQEGSRVVLEKPFGRDLESARRLNAAVHDVFDESQVFRIDHFLGKEAALNIPAMRFANGLFEPIWHRNFISHVQIDIPETLGLDGRIGFYEKTGAYKDMVVTHLFQVLAFIAMEAPTALDPQSITEEKNKVFRSMLPIDPHQVVRGQYSGYHDEDGVDPDSDTETFIALKCFVDNWRWADVPFFLRTGKKLSEGQRIISIAFREPPKSMFPEGSGIGDHGPDHLTFDLADEARMSLSFYGKRPGPGFRLVKQSMQFAMDDTGWAGSVLEAYERLILDAVKGNHTLFTTAEGVERLWEISEPLLENPPPVREYAAGSWGPNQIHQLVAPFTWRLPFERKWRGNA